MKYLQRLSHYYVIKQLQKIVNKHDKNVKVILEPKYGFNAGYNPSTLQIIIGTELIQSLTKRELQSVLYHELAHAIDPEIQKAYLHYSNNEAYSYIDSKAYRHAREFFAASLGLTLFKDVSACCTALNKLIRSSTYRLDRETRQHPSFLRRLEALNMYSILK